MEISQKSETMKQINEEIREIYAKANHTMNTEIGGYGHTLTPLIAVMIVERWFHPVDKPALR